MVSFVNFVNYIISMNKENKNQENQSSQSGIYLRDDHCDWGSSGMNEFTNEYSEDK